MSLSISLAIVLVLVAALSVVLYKAYFGLPVYELKRRARTDNKSAKLYQAAAYGRPLRALLYLVMALACSAAFIILSRRLQFGLALIVIGLVILIIFNWLAQSRVSSAGLFIGRLFSPFLKSSMGYLYRPLGYLVERLKPLTEEPTGLYEREDLIKLLKRQINHPASRFSQAEIELLLRAAKFSDLKVQAAIIKTSKLKKVAESAVVGPVLINDIHKSGLPFALVLDKKGGQIVGTLAFREIGINSSGLVKDYMTSNLYYLHEDDSLASAFRAASLTHSPVFVVVGGNGDTLGVVTTQSLLAGLIGQTKTGQGFEDYGDKQAVINHHQDELTNQAKMAE